MELTWANYQTQADAQVCFGCNTGLRPPPNCLDPNCDWGLEERQMKAEGCDLHLVVVFQGQKATLDLFGLAVQK